MADDDGQVRLMITPAVVTAARDLTMNSIELGKIASAKSDEEGINDVFVGMLAYGSLLITCARKLNISLNEALQAADAVLGGRIPTSDMVN